MEKFLVKKRKIGDEIADSLPTNLVNSEKISYKAKLSQFSHEAYNPWSEPGCSKRFSPPPIGATDREIDNQSSSTSKNADSLENDDSLQTNKKQKKGNFVQHESFFGVIKYCCFFARFF